MLIGEDETRPHPRAPTGPRPQGLDWPTRCAQVGKALWPTVVRELGADAKHVTVSFAPGPDGLPIPKFRVLTPDEIRDRDRLRAAARFPARRGGLTIAEAEARQRAVERKILGLDRPFAVRRLMVESLIKRWP